MKKGELMMTEQKNRQNRMLCVLMEDLVPKGHFLRKLDAAIDFSLLPSLRIPEYMNPLEKQSLKKSF
jgi:hypothetical protein